MKIDFVRFGYVSLLAAILLSVQSCQQTKREPDVSFSSLTEDEKRLPENALAGFTVVDGQEVELFASEPMVTNPTNISIDHKGRVWVCEAYNYDVSPEEADKKGDRIIVLEDTDHDGKADKRTVFYQGTDITTPLGIFVAGNLVYVSRSPNILVFSDIDGDLVADKKDTLFTNLGNKGDHSAHSILPGPDGKLYFSTGNFAGEIRDKSGNPVKDRAGFTVTQKGNPYLGGMIMRFDVDGNQFEVLGHNFRNNYEPCVDSYGNVWQSDNDDDGNESCRVNFIMPFGNYGYVDEMTRASWTSGRVGIETDVPDRHWHQNDPGVVPNVLITGAGSPAGMVMYEGNELSPEFHGMPVHAEPYYNVVRAYLTKKTGTGFSASTKDILKSQDQWFRPVDVSVAPDGSLFVADWYDPILGGGAAGDAGRGRIFRVAKKANVYNVPASDIQTVSGNADALMNPNPETRFLAQGNLRSAGNESIRILKQKWTSGSPLEKVRAFWVLAALAGDDVIDEALNDSNPDIRIAAIRFVQQYRKDVVPYLSRLKNDPDLHVKRELITGLRYASDAAGAELWTAMALQYHGNDRWYLEALGIGSDLHAALYFNSWLQKVKPDPGNAAHRDIIWRIRSSKAVPLLGKIIASTHDVDSAARLLRAFDFHIDPAKNEVLLSLLNSPNLDGKISALTLQQIDPQNVRRTASLNNALNMALEDTRGTTAFVDLVAKYNLIERKKDLVAIAIENPGSETASAAVDQLIRFNAITMVRDVLKRDDASSVALLKGLESKGSREIVALIAEVLSDSSKDISLRQNAVMTLGTSWPGEDKLLELVKNKSFPKDLKAAASGVLFNVYRSSIQREAAKYLARPQTKGSQLPSIKELVASSGNASDGEQVFVKFCVSCHRVKDQGVKFGPELSQIGSKLSKDGLYRAIIFPDEGISHGFAASLLTMKDRTQVIGIITNATNQEVELAVAGGTVNKYSRGQIQNIEESDHSIMPALAPAMSKQELIDLVMYLAELKN